MTQDGRDYSVACPKCGDWLPTPAAYAAFRGFMLTSHTCYCGETTTRDPQSDDAARGQG